MGVFSRVLRPSDERALTASEAIRRLIYSTITRAGVPVDEQSSLRLMAVFTAVRIISETFAQVPLKIYRRKGNGGREEARDHPLFDILHARPNSEMTSFTLREILMGHLLTWGNAYCEISRNRLGEAIGLWPLLPDRTKPLRREDGELVYVTRISRDPANLRLSETITLPAKNVLHIPGLGFDGLLGYSVIGTVREGLGLAFAYEQFGASFFGNNAIPGFILSTDQQLKKDVVDDLERKFKEGHESLNNAQRLSILTGGLKPERIGIPPNEAQFIESKQYSRAEIMGLFRIPPPLTGDTDKASAWGSGMAELKTAFVTYTMMPWFERVEQAINMKLFGANAQGPIYPKFVVSGLLRGDYKTRMEGHAIGRQWGWLSANDVRRDEEEEPIGAEGDLYLVPVNMQTAQQALKGPQAPTPQAIDAPPGGGGGGGDGVKAEPAAARARLAAARAHRFVLGDTTERILRRERADVGRAVEQHSRRGAMEDLPGWLGAFYQEHRTWATDALVPALASLAESVAADVAREIGAPAAVPERFVRQYADGYAARLGEESRADLRAAIVGIPEVERIFAGWDRRALRVAEREIVRACGAFAKAAYREAHIGQLCWVTLDDQPDCRSRDGQVASLEDGFPGLIGHPPANAECGCVVMAVIQTSSAAAA